MPLFMLCNPKQSIPLTFCYSPLLYLLSYSAGGMHSMLFKWAEGGMAIPSTELIEALKQGFRSEEL